MESELRGLEERVEMMTALVRQLRSENAELRQAVLAAQAESRMLREKVEAATQRVQRLIERLPEDAT
jgi:uncharacterized protein (TIGR02449 family)